MTRKTRMADEELAQVPASAGYLIVDSNKCSGCQTCMVACSLAHEGVENLQLSRIQILYDPWGNYPDNIKIAQCVQCQAPECMAVCPTDAVYADAGNGNVRRIFDEKCIGCWKCVKACPYTPSRMPWNFEKNIALKCDHCADTPYWNEAGKTLRKACIELCPLQAIQYVEAAAPADGVYDVNLRKEDWPLDKSK